MDFSQLTPNQLALPGLAFLFIISFVGTIPFPLPITITVLWLSQFHFPVAVVLVSTIGSLLGWIYFEKAMRRWLFNRPQWQAKIPPAYQKFFLRKTGFWLFVFNAVPFPFDPIRFLALLNGYDRTRFLLILGASRLIRNTILVTLGVALAQYKLLFWLALIFFLLLPVITDRLLQRFFQRHRAQLP